MSRKPFFRTYDSWWYVYIGEGNARRRVKLAKGKDNDQVAYRAFCRLMADTGLAALKPASLTVEYICDRFLDVTKPQIADDSFKQYNFFLQKFCDL